MYNPVIIIWVVFFKDFLSHFLRSFTTIDSISQPITLKLYEALIKMILRVQSIFLISKFRCLWKTKQLLLVAITFIALTLGTVRTITVITNIINSEIRILHLWWLHFLTCDEYCIHSRCVYFAVCLSTTLFVMIPIVDWYLSTIVTYSTESYYQSANLFFLLFRTALHIIDTWLLLTRDSLRCQRLRFIADFLAMSLLHKRFSVFNSRLLPIVGYRLHGSLSISVRIGCHSVSWFVTFICYFTGVVAYFDRCRWYI